MKNLYSHFLLTLLFFVMLACQKKEGPSQNEAPRENNKISTTEISSITEYELTGLAQPTSIRIAKATDKMIVSFFSQNTTYFKSKTLIASKVGSQNLIEESSNDILFKNESTEKVSRKIIVNTQFDLFKKVIQLTHIKDIYRCRSSQFWPLLLSHTPEQRGYALLALGEEMIHLDLNWEILLAIDLKDSNVVHFSIKKSNTDFHQAYYTSLVKTDSEYVWGLEGSTTKSFFVFNLSCDESYEKIAPHFYGKGYQASIDQQASLASDVFLERILKDSKITSPMKVDSFFDNGNALVVRELNSHLKTYEDYNKPFIQDFYDSSLNKIKNSQKTGAK